MTPPRSPKQVYLDTVKPEDFADIQIHDWVEGVGDVSTHYEEKFLRNYGKLLASRPASPSCTWKLDDEYGMYETGCGNAFECIEGDIEENNFKFCPYCGGRIKEIVEGAP